MGHSDSLSSAVCWYQENGTLGGFRSFLFSPHRGFNPPQSAPSPLTFCLLQCCFIDCDTRCIETMTTQWKVHRVERSFESQTVLWVSAWSKVWLHICNSGQILCLNVSHLLIYTNPTRNNRNYKLILLNYQEIRRIILLPVCLSDC